jgi:hypothetical protein
MTRAAARSARALEALDDRREQARRDREVVRGSARVSEFPSESGVGRGIAVVAVDVPEQRVELCECVRFERSVLRHAVSCAGAQLIEGPIRFCDADHRHVEAPPARHRVQCREDLLESQVAGRAEEDECVGPIDRHGLFSATHNVSRAVSVMARPLCRV